MRSAWLTSLRSIRPPMMQPARKRMVLGDRALAFRGGEHRRAEPLGERAPARPRRRPRARRGPTIRIGRLARRSMSKRRLEVGPVGARADEVGQERRLGQVVAGLARRLALRQLELHRPRRRRRRHAHGAAHLLAHGLGIDGRAPLDERRVDGQLVDALAQAGLVGGPRIGVGDGDQRRAVEQRVGDAVDHVGGARPAGREAHARAAGDLAPGRRQHGAGHLLLHQEEAHLPLAAGLHQLDRLAAGVADDERRARLLEGRGKHLDGCGHARSSRFPILAAGRWPSNLYEPAANVCGPMRNWPRRGPSPRLCVRETRKEPRGGADAQDGPDAAHGLGSAARARDRGRLRRTTPPSRCGSSFRSRRAAATTWSRA